MSCILVGLQWNRHVSCRFRARPISAAAVPARPSASLSIAGLSSDNALHMPCWPGYVSQAGESGTGLRSNSRRAYRYVSPGPVCGLRPAGAVDELKSQLPSRAAISWEGYALLYSIIQVA